MGCFVRVLSREVGKKKFEVARLSNEISLETLPVESIFWSFCGSENFVGVLFRLQRERRNFEVEGLLR